jgi:hypothetical protein
MNNAELIRGLYTLNKAVLCSNGTIYRLGEDSHGRATLEFLPESSQKAGDGEFKTGGKGDALNKPVRFISDSEIAALVKPKMVTVPADELAALQARIATLQAQS